MITLRREFPSFYYRMRRLAITNALLGIALIISPPIPVSSAKSSVMYGVANLKVWGTVFLVIGIMMVLGMYIKTTNYVFSRASIGLAFGYALIWWISLMLSIFQGSLQSAGIVILWGWWTVELFNAIKDPSWTAVQAARKIDPEAVINGHNNGR